MRSSVYLPLIPALLSFAFAKDIPGDTAPVIVPDEAPEVIVGTAPGGRQNSLSRRTTDYSSLSSTDPPFYDSQTSFDSLDLVDSSSDEILYGYTCQKDLYDIKHLEKSAQHACTFIKNNKQMKGRVKYPAKLSGEYLSASQYLFPVLPNNKIFNGGYFQFENRLKYFLVISSDCKRAKMVYRVWEDSHKPSKFWCRRPKCLLHRDSSYLDCTSLYIETDSAL